MQVIGNSRQKRMIPPQPQLLPEQAKYYVRRFGLFTKTDPAPLISLDTQVNIIDSIARVTLTQIYHNPYPRPIEIEYLFPISDIGCFDSFEAIYEEKSVKGIIKKKDVAKKEYDEGVARGDMMGYAEIKEETPDVMKVELGNLPGGKLVTIKLTYIQKLEISQNKYWKFHLPSTLTPRFDKNPKKLPG